MSTSERNNFKQLNRRASEYGMSIHKSRNGGFYFLIDEINAVWSEYGAFHTLGEVEELLNDKEIFE